MKFRQIYSRTPVECPLSYLSGTPEKVLWRFIHLFVLRYLQYISQLIVLIYGFLKIPPESSSRIFSRASSRWKLLKICLNFFSIFQELFQVVMKGFMLEFLWIFLQDLPISEISQKI